MAEIGNIVQCIDMPDGPDNPFTSETQYKVIDRQVNDQGQLIVCIQDPSGAMIGWWFDSRFIKIGA
jgi:hypothetical protein